MTKPRLSAEDQARVDAYLSSGYNSVERQPFRGWRLLFLLYTIVFILGGLSYLVAKLYGVI